MANHTNAQNKDLYNVKLKSGLVIKCELLKMVTDSFVIVRQYGQVNTIKYSDILRIDFAETIIKSQIDATDITPLSNDQAVYFRRNVPDSGFSFGIQPGICVGDQTASILLRFSFLTNITKRLDGGLAIGMDPYLNYSSVLISALGEGRYYMVKNKPRSPFLHGQCGYGFNILANNGLKHGGLSYAFGLGQAFRDKKQNIFSLMVGYRSQQYTDIRDINNQGGNPTNRTYHYLFNRVEVKVEFRFK